VSRALASNDRLIGGGDRGGVVGRGSGSVGLRDGEAAALLRADDEPAACASDGPFAPCEIFARPVLRDYATYLRESGVDVVADDDEEEEEEEEADSITPNVRAFSRSAASSNERRCMLAACGLGALHVVDALLRSGMPPLGSHLRAAAASLAPTAAAVVDALLAADDRPTAIEDIVHDASDAGTLATHLAAARGCAKALASLLAAGARAGARDADKQTILHLAVRSGDLETTRVAAAACASLKPRKGGIEAWDRWKRTPAAWALLLGDADALAVLRDAGADLTRTEREVSESTNDEMPPPPTTTTTTAEPGTLSRRSEVQLNQRPARKSRAPISVMRALARKLSEGLDVGSSDDDKSGDANRRGERMRTDAAERLEAVAALRALACANAANRENARAFGVIPSLCEIARREHCVEAIGALRNLAHNSEANASEAGACGAIGALAEIIRRRAAGARAAGGADASTSSSPFPLAGEDRRVVFAAASALTSLTVKHPGNAARLESEKDVREIIEKVIGEGAGEGEEE
jgi:hypothetical protein